MISMVFGDWMNFGGFATTSQVNCLDLAVTIYAREV